jgi:CRISPR-associated endonuclease/helicase Cas3
LPIGKRTKPHGWGTVYADLRILEATWQQLESIGHLEIPEQNRHLVEMSTHPEALTAAVARAVEREPAMRDAWEAHGNEVDGKDSAHRTVAKQACMPWDRFFGDPEVCFEPGREFTTRLGEQDRQVEFEEPFPMSPFGNPIRRLTLPAHWVGDSEQEPEVRHVPNPDGFTFTFEDKAFRYDRLGLRPEEGEARLASTGSRQKRVPSTKS